MKTTFPLKSHLWPIPLSGIIPLLSGPTCLLISDQALRLADGEGQQAAELHREPVSLPN